jgi:hypothetical protein
MHVELLFQCRKIFTVILETVVVHGGYLHCPTNLMGADLFSSPSSSSFPISLSDFYLLFSCTISLPSLVCPVTTDKDENFSSEASIPSVDELEGQWCKTDIETSDEPFLRSTELNVVVDNSDSVN